MSRVEFIKKIFHVIFFTVYVVSFWRCKKFLDKLSSSSVSGFHIGKKEEKAISSYLKNFYRTDSNYQGVAETYLKRFSDENQLPQLLRLICSSLRPEDDVFKTSGSLNAKKFEDFLFKKIRKDFRDDQIISLDQWILSKTEARIAVAQRILNKP